jgi:peptidoglycan/xylan/chitin deacetylase (PgdA/CDA1 family)
MTFFVVRSASAWKQLAKPITELAATGRLQLANHTSTHINLVKASKAKIKQELLDCDKFIKQTFNYDPGTYFRPPYGYIDHRVIKIAKEVGYTTPTLWFGSTGAGSVKNSAQDWALCKKWMTMGRLLCV